jgi:pyrimidine-specific ribonucleoside hydrolase
VYPELFDMKPQIREPRIVRSVNYDPAMMKTVLMEVLAGEYRMGEGIAFAGFPLDAGIYRQDVRKIMDTALSRYGMAEWKACVLTDEIHGHLGIYSVVGAKMGIRALEYFGVGTDRLHVVSYAGSKPPVSCLNDGIQVSTGATIGQGTILLAEGSEVFPGAEFEYQGRRILLTIRTEFLRQIEADISRGIARYGLLNAGYWKLVRNLSLQYWRDWNRNELFEITLIN